MDEFASRLNECIKALKDRKLLSSQTELAEKLNTTPQSITEVLKGRVKVSPSFIQYICKEYGVSTEWFVFGRGSMFMENSSYVSEEEPGYYTRSNNASLPLVVTVDHTGDENIIMVDQRAAAGYVQHLTDTSFYKSLPAFNLPTPQFRNETLRCFQVDGWSMEPTLYTGDWVIASYVDNWKYNIKENYIYVIVTKDRVMVKRLLNRIADQNKVYIVSDNEAEPTRPIEAEEIQQLWYVKAHIGFHMPNQRFSVQNKIHNLEAEILSLESTLKTNLEGVVEKMVEEKIKATIRLLTNNQ